MENEEGQKQSQEMALEPILMAGARSDNVLKMRLSCCLLFLLPYPYANDDIVADAAARKG